MPRMRVFLAAAINDSVRKKVVALQESFAELGSPVKWVSPVNLHVTLMFLGEVDDREVVDVCRAVRTVVAGRPPFQMRLSNLGGFPNLRRPRTLWLGLDEGADELIELHRLLVDGLLDLGCYRREEREYRPHLTLGRVKGDDLSPDLQAALAQKAEWTSALMPVNEIHVYQSKLKSDDPEYIVLSRERLKGKG